MPGRNGKNNPPRPRIEIRHAAASPEEAAAISTAIQQFIAEATPAAAAERQNPWQRAALREGIAARQIEPGGWGPAVGR